MVASVQGWLQMPSFYLDQHSAGRIDEGGQSMSKNQRNTPRMPATKFANLRKKIQQQKVPVKSVKKGKT